jgi:hypothetical protein
VLGAALLSGPPEPTVDLIHHPQSRRVKPRLGSLAEALGQLGTRRKRKADKKVQGGPALDVDQVRELLKAIAESKVCEGKDLATR